MRNLRTRFAAVVLGATSFGCAPSGGGPPVGAAPAGPPIAQPGDGYVMLYADGSGIRLRNTASVVDSVFITGATDVDAKPSPDRAAVAVSYGMGNSTRLVMIDAVGGAASEVHSAPGRGVYTFEWAGGSDALGIGYRTTDGSAPSAVLVADRNGNVRNVGCSASNRFVAWRAGGQIVVSDGTNMYTVDARDCRTLATLPMSGKSDITYSPDGNRIFFLRRGSLFIAQHDGANTKEIVAARSRAGNVRWSPDSRRIALEIASPRYANRTHVAIYDFATDQTTFNAEEKPLGVPSDDSPCWSPDGTRLALDRSYNRRGEDGDYVQRQKVVTAVSGNDENVVSEELIRGTAPGGRSTCAWVDERHIALDSTDGPRIFNVDSKAAYRLPGNAKLLYARVENR